MIVPIVSRKLIALSLSVAILTPGFISPIAEASNTNSVILNRNASQYFNLPDTDVFDFSETVSIEAWVKLVSPIPATSNFGIVSKGDGFDYGYSFRLRDIGGNQNQLNFAYSDGNEFIERSWDVNVPIGSWVHVAAVAHAPTQSIKLFVNGQENSGVANGTGTFIRDSAGSLHVGNDSWGEGRHMDGLIDEVRIWGNELTPQEITSRMHSTLAGDEPGLVGYWRFNGASPADATSNANHLTAINGAGFSTDVPFPITPPPAPLKLKAVKLADETLTSETNLQPDDELGLVLASHTTYIVDGVIFVSASRANPDLKISLTGPVGSEMKIGYLTDTESGVLDGEPSSRIDVSSGPLRPIFVKGTITTGESGGELQLEWAPWLSQNAVSTLHEGSFLRAQEI